MSECKSSIDKTSFYGYTGLEMLLKFPAVTFSHSIIKKTIKLFDTDCTLRRIINAEPTTAVPDNKFIN